MSEHSIKPLLAHTVETRAGGFGILPSIFWPIFSVIHYVHRYTYWKAKLDRTTENYGVEYVPGGIIQLVWGENKTVQVMAKVSEVALHTLRAIEDLRRLKESFQRLYQLATTEEEYYHPLEWDSYTESAWISLSTRIWIQEQYHRTAYKTRLIADCILNILKDSYLLSRDLMYAEFAWEGHPFQVTEAGAHLYDIHKEVKNDLLKGLGIEITDKPPPPPPKPKSTLMMRYQEFKKIKPKAIGKQTCLYLFNTLSKIAEFFCAPPQKKLYPPPERHPYIQISVRKKFRKILQ
ncbi:MAG: hypothetical protein KDK62_03310 [Chlamydiia bacterium]|nr:hypothetical protein [Chlamydiia bacterium]